MSCGLRERLDDNLEPEVLEPTQGVAPQPLRVQAVEMGWTQISVRDPVAEDVPHGDEDTVADRHGGLLGASAPGDPRGEAREGRVTAM